MTSKHVRDTLLLTITPPSPGNDINHTKQERSRPARYPPLFLHDIVSHQRTASMMGRAKRHSFITQNMKKSRPSTTFYPSSSCEFLGTFANLPFLWACLKLGYLSHFSKPSLSLVQSTDLDPFFQSNCYVTAVHILPNQTEYISTPLTGGCCRATLLKNGSPESCIPRVDLYFASSSFYNNKLGSAHPPRNTTENNNTNLVSQSFIVGKDCITVSFFKFACFDLGL